MTMTKPGSSVTADFPDLDTLTFEVVDGTIGVLRINRPDRMNSQTVQMFTEYGQAAFALRDSGLRALILTATGVRAFCAGFDLEEIDVITRMGCARVPEVPGDGLAASRRSGTCRSR
jgi:enoyl-CoA hydratase/carnithine racemase